MLEKLKNKPILINSDLDGIMSGLLLQKHLNCKVVGFTNSAETIWMQKNFTNFKDICFVDMFVANPEITCIDQHIVSVNEIHHDVLKVNPNKINPNLINPRFHLPNSSYKLKYPFGTVHFIIAFLEKMGIEIDAIITETNPHKLCCIDFILRADDTMKTTTDSKYMDNAKDWWNWLKKLSNNGQSTQKFINYLEDTTPKKAKELKRRIGDILKKDPYYCDSSDGGIDEVTTQDNILKTSSITYFKLVASLMQIDMFDVTNSYKKYNGIVKRLSLSKNQQEELISLNAIDGKKLFSYAFVRTASRKENFSCTFYQES
ncbi:MAG: hypothetical protein COA67_02935 [Lutibacter sp.]|nr:MAG: hypothetical protein COA67_02935 [Lutibacter sp.]